VKGLPIGIVTAIAAPASIKVEFEGNGGHAGAVLMPARFVCGCVFTFPNLVYAQNSRLSLCETLSQFLFYFIVMPLNFPFIFRK